MADLRDTSSAKQGEAITPHNTNQIEPCRCLYIGTGGDIAVQFHDGGPSVTLANLEAGYHPLSVRKVLATGTTASDIVALY